MGESGFTQQRARDADYLLGGATWQRCCAANILKMDAEGKNNLSLARRANCGPGKR